MANRLVRIACVLVVAALTTHGCIFGKKGTGTGTNIGSGYGSGDDLPPPGQPTFTENDR